MAGKARKKINNGGFGVKKFEERQLFEAIGFAAAGGQALHLFAFPGDWPGAPRCFKGATQTAHLFDQDVERLIERARELGVKVIKVHCKGTPKQHVDLCGRPLRQAVKFVEGYKQSCLDMGVEISK